MRRPWPVRPGRVSASRALVEMLRAPQVVDEAGRPDPPKRAARGRLRGADLRGADLRHAELVHADLTSADLTGADLRSADLSWASLDGACLAGATLGRARLVETTFRGADLRGADLSSVTGLSVAGLKHAVSDDHTRWPPGFDTRRPTVAGPVIHGSPRRSRA